MNNFDFSVLTATDRNYWDAFLLSCEESGEKFAKGTFGYVIGGSIEIGGVREVEANTDLATAFQCEGRLFSPIELHTKSGKSVLITRKISTGLDVISVRPKSAEDSDIVTYSKFVVAAQKIFGMKGATQQPFFPKEHADFFRAQEAAIEKLTRAIAHAGLELEQSRSRLNDEFDEREKAQQVRHLEKEAELEQARIKLNNDFEARDRTRELRQAEKDVEIDRRFEERTKLLDERHLKALDAVAKQREELEAEKKALDDRNATHARRKHQEDIDTLFGNLEKEFGVTKGTQWKGAAVYQTGHLVC